MLDAAETVVEKVLPPAVRDFQWAGTLAGIPVYLGWIHYDAQQDRFLAKRLPVLDVPCYIDLRFWRGPQHGEELICTPAPEDTNYILSEINRCARKEGYAFRAELVSNNLKLRPIYLDEL